MSNETNKPNGQDQPASAAAGLLAMVLEWIHDNHNSFATENDTTRTLGLDSPDFAEIALHVEETLQQDIPEAWLERLTADSTLKEWAEEVAKHMAHDLPQHTR